MLEKLFIAVQGTIPQKVSTEPSMCTLRLICFTLQALATGWA